MEVFGRSLFKMMGIDLPVPDRLTISKHGKTIPLDDFLCYAKQQRE